MVVLQANDGTLCVFTHEQLRHCNVLCIRAADVELEVIPLENVDGCLLQWLHRYTATLVDHAPETCEQRCMDMVGEYTAPLDLLRLANYLDVTSLQKHACLHVAGLMRRCRTSTDMCALFRTLCDIPDAHVASLYDIACHASFNQLLEQVAVACVEPIAHL